MHFLASFMKILYCPGNSKEQNKLFGEQIAGALTLSCTTLDLYVHVMVRILHQINSLGNDLYYLCFSAG